MASSRSALEPPPAPAECAPPEVLLVEQQAAFRDQWEHLWQDSPFYRRKLKSACLSATCPPLSDLSDVPFTDKHEVRASLAERPPLGEHLAVAPESVAQVQMSSGTSGQPSMVALTTRDAQGWAELLRRGYVAVGYRPSDMILHAFAMSRGWVGGLPMVQGILALGATVLPIGAEAGSDRILDIMSSLRPSGLQASPGFLANLARRASERGLRPASLGVRHLLTGGEPGGGIPSVRAELETSWGAPVREVMGGSDIACMFWAECAEGDGMHLVGPDLIWFELIEPETARPVAVETGAFGELVYTHLRRDATPVLRFRHRDLVKVLGTGLCACGRATPRIRCVGRSDDMLIVRGVNVFPSAVKELLGNTPGVEAVFRIRRPRGTYVLPGPVEIMVEAHTQDDETRTRIERRLHEQLSCRFSVTLRSPGSLAVPGSTKEVYFEEV